MKTIEVTVSSKGETTVETKGFAGPACKIASEFLERALGRTTAERKTAEFYRPAGQQAEAKQQG
jgi:hypothetical protein